MPYLTIYHWTKSSLHKIKQNKNANNASELSIVEIYQEINIIMKTKHEVVFRR